MRLNHNMMSLSAFNTYKKNCKKNSAAMEKISTGLKINSAKDNPNKLAQSEKMRIQIKSLESASRNVQDATSLLNTADSALQEIDNILIRMKELAVSAANGTNSDTDIKAIQLEMNDLKKCIDDLSSYTEFNGLKIIGYDQVQTNKYPIHSSTVCGAMVGERINIPLYNLSTDLLQDSNGNSLKNVDISTQKQAEAGIETIDEVIRVVGSVRGKYGALSSRFESTAEAIESNSYMLSRAESNIRDTDIAIEMMEIARTDVLRQSANALIAQSNRIPQDALKVLQNSRR